MADTSSLHPRVQRFVMAFYVSMAVMWLGGFIASVTHHDTLLWVFYGVLYTQAFMVTYGNINRSMRSRRRRKEQEVYEQYVRYVAYVEKVMELRKKKYGQRERQTRMRLLQDELYAEMAKQALRHDLLRHLHG